MHITIQGVHIDVTDAMRDYVNERIGSLGKYVQNKEGATVRVDISKTTGHHAHGEFFQVEAIARVKGKDFVVKSVREDVYAAIDEVKDMLSRDLTTYKDKQFSLFKRGAQRIKKLLRFER